MITAIRHTQMEIKLSAINSFRASMLSINVIQIEAVTSMRYLAMKHTSKIPEPYLTFLFSANFFMLPTASLVLALARFNDEMKRIRWAESQNAEQSLRNRLPECPLLLNNKLLD